MNSLARKLPVGIQAHGMRHAADAGLGILLWRSDKVICHVSCSNYVVDRRLHFVCWFAEGGVAVGVVAAFLFPVGVLGVEFSRVVILLAAGVAGFPASEKIDARFMHGSETFS